MMRYLRAAVTVLVGVLLILFAVANRGLVAVSFWPLPLVMQLPLYVLLLLALAGGAVVGGLVVGMRSLARRREAARLRQRITLLEHQLEMDRKQHEEEARAAGRRPSLGRALTGEPARG